MVGVFYRLCRGNEDDWKTHAMLGKPRPPDVSQCRWQSLSIFDSLDGSRRLASRVPKFKKHRPMCFSIDGTMGDLLAGRDGHHDWWPSPTFAPPPGDLRLDDEAADE